MSGWLGTGKRTPVGVGLHGVGDEEHGVDPSKGGRQMVFSSWDPLTGEGYSRWIDFDEPKGSRGRVLVSHPDTGMVPLEDYRSWREKHIERLKAARG